MDSEQVLYAQSRSHLPYPHLNDTSVVSIAKLGDNDYENGKYSTEKYHVGGRIMSKRVASSKLYFYELFENGQSIQLMFNKSIYSGNFDINKNIHVGDVVHVYAFYGKSNTGESTLFVTSCEIVTPCLRMLPKLHFGLHDCEQRARKRYLDLIANPNNISVYEKRAKIFRGLRRFLEEKDFIEVHTPILGNQVGGANAKPFVTYHNDLKEEMFMRISPELFLKQLVVGGMHRIFEIGPQFRNESVDRTHNPEFYSIELYVAFWNYLILMNMTEELLSHLVKSVCGKLQITYTKDGVNHDIDFTPPYCKIDITSELLKNGINIFENGTINSEETRLYLDSICRERNIPCGEPRTIARLLDKLIGEYIEPQCHNPTFVMNHPLVMSPLSKSHSDNNQLAERFELFILGMEICNAYTELNDPNIQRQTFEDQMKSKALGDEEAQSIDEQFIDALSYGLPPTGGFGMGLDRFVMLLTNQDTIRNVIAFPAMGKI